MKIITEHINEPLSMFLEADSSGKKMMKIKGPGAVWGRKNKNGREYPEHVLESAINKYTEDFIKTRRSLGEMNHPARLNVDYERATHIVTGLERDGNTWIMEANILPTTYGPPETLRGLIEAGVSVGVSTRGAGSIVERAGSKFVSEDYFMTAFDIVTDPSGPGCFVNGIMEGVEIVKTDDGRIIEKTFAEIAKKEYDKKRLTEEVKKKLFKDFLNMVSKLGA